MIDIEFNKKDVMISWSGGLDSTLIFLKAIEKLNNGELDSILLVYYDTIVLNRKKKEKEKRSRYNILQQLKKSGIINERNKSKIHSTVIYMDYLDDSIDDSSYSYIGYTKKLSAPQPFLWLTTVLPYVNDRYELIYGHLADDSYSISGGYNENLYKMLDCTNIAIGKEFIMNLPLIQYTKEDIVREYFENEKYLQILPLLSFCEEPNVDNESCGVCICCMQMKEILLNNGYNKIYIEMMDGKESSFCKIIDYEYKEENESEEKYKDE